MNEPAQKPRRRQSTVRRELEVSDYSTQLMLCIGDPSCRDLAMEVIGEIAASRARQQAARHLDEIAKMKDWPIERLVAEIKDAGDLWYFAQAEYLRRKREQKDPTP